MSALRRGSARRSAAQKRRLHPLAISALTILGTVFVIYYAFHQGLPFVHHFTLHTYVQDSLNVRQDSPVRIAGIDVGKVQSTSPAGRATEINFTIDDNGRPVHTDATVRVRDRLFLEGGYYLELDPGSPSAPVLRDGGVIPQSQTSYPVQFYKVLSTFDSATRQSLTNTLTTFDTAFDPPPGQPQSDSGAGAFKRAVPELTPALKDVAIVTRSLRGTAVGDVGRLLSSSSQVTSTLAASSSQLADLVTGLNATSSALAAADGALAQTVSGLDQTLQQAPSDLSAVDRVLPPLVNLSNALDPSLRVAPPILDGLITTVGDLAAVVAPAERARLLSSLKATFVQFPSLQTKLATAFPIGKSVTDCLRTHVTPTLNKIAPDGALSSGRPVWQDFIHFLPGLASAAQNFDANGYWIRLLAGVGTQGLSLGTLPGVGTVLGTAPSNSPIQGSRPEWVGNLPASVFHPEASCQDQPVPSLASPTAAPDTRRASFGSPVKPMSLAQLTAAVARASKVARSRATQAPGGGTSR